MNGCVDPCFKFAGTAAESEVPIKIPYRMPANIPDLYIRKAAGINCQKDGFTGKGVFTIVDVTGRSAVPGRAESEGFFEVL